MATLTKQIITLLYQATTTTTPTAADIFEIDTDGTRTIQALISGTGAVSATVEFYGSNANDLTTGLLLATATLSGTTTDSTGGAMSAEYPYMWAKVTAISGTSAKVTATVSV